MEIQMLKDKLGEHNDLKEEELNDLKVKNLKKYNKKTKKLTINSGKTSPPTYSRHK